LIGKTSLYLCELDYDYAKVNCFTRGLAEYVSISKSLTEVSVLSFLILPWRVAHNINVNGLVYRYVFRVLLVPLLERRLRRTHVTVCE